MQIHKASSVLILCHFYKRASEAGGPPQEVRNYLLPKVGFLAYIEHPFPYANDKRSSLTVYKNGKRIKTIFTPALFGPDIVFYIADIFITWYFLIRINKKIDLCVALDGLNVLSTILFRKIGIIKILAYYTIDYTPYRFSNKLLNTMYLFIDKVACYTSDVIWILSKRMIPAREKSGVDPQKSAPSILLPMGADTARIKLLPMEKINKYTIVFVGHLLQKQGVQLILEALPKVIKIIPQLEFLIIGQGEYKETLKQIADKLNIKNHVNFLGFVEKHEDVEKILTRCAVGLAPYIPDSDNYTYYTDPGKPKLYLACGLPVVITDVPESARIIEKAGAGICISYEKEAFTKAIVKLLKNDRIYKKYRENAIKLSKKFDTNTMIATAVKKT